MSEKVKINFRLDRPTLEDVEELAEERGESRSETLRFLIRGEVADADEIDRLREELEAVRRERDALRQEKARQSDQVLTILENLTEKQQDELEIVETIEERTRPPWWKRILPG